MNTQQIDIGWFQSCGLAPPTPAAADFVCAAAASRHAGHMATVSGRLFDLVNPDSREIEIDEIAHHLAHINRFTGATPFPYSVAQHSCHCAAEYCRRYSGADRLVLSALACLLHDAAEAYCGDVSRPLKQLIGSTYRPIEDRVQAAIWRRFGLTPGPLAIAAVHEIDQAVVMAEALQMMPGAKFWKWGNTRPASIECRPVDPERVRVMFLEIFNTLRGTSGGEL